VSDPTALSPTLQVQEKAGSDAFSDHFQPFAAPVAWGSGPSDRPAADPPARSPTLQVQEKAGSDAFSDHFRPFAAPVAWGSSQNISIM